jgi:uncharacterized protein (DUF488 family)
LSEPTIHTIGHSTRAADELLALLRDTGMRGLADVRRFPSSRRHPQHNRGALERTLADAGVAYEWLGETLGGRVRQRVPTAESRNNGWDVAAFRSYADAMTTPEFHAGLAQLEARARQQPTAVMCAERLWWQCHRRLIADALTVRGWNVVHLLEPGKSHTHRLTEFARIEDGVLVYPALV